MSRGASPWAAALAAIMAASSAYVAMSALDGQTTGSVTYEVALCSSALALLLSASVIRVPQMLSSSGTLSDRVLPVLGVFFLFTSSTLFLETQAQTTPPDRSILMGSALFMTLGHRLASGGMPGDPRGRSGPWPAVATGSASAIMSAWTVGCGLGAGQSVLIDFWSSLPIVLIVFLAAGEVAMSAFEMFERGDPGTLLFLSSAAFIPPYSLSTIFSSWYSLPGCPCLPEFLAPLLFFFVSGAGLALPPALVEVSAPLQPPPEGGVLLEFEPTPGGLRAAVDYIYGVSRRIGGPVVLISRRTSPLFRTMSKMAGVDLLIEVSPGVSYSRSGDVISSPPDAPSISKAVRDAEEMLGDRPGLLVVDSMTDLIFLSGVEEAYKIARELVEILSGGGWRGIFLMASGAHDRKVSNLLRSLFWPA